MAKHSVLADRPPLDIGFWPCALRGLGSKPAELPFRIGLEAFEQDLE